MSALGVPHQQKPCRQVHRLWPASTRQKHPCFCQCNHTWALHWPRSVLCKSDRWSWEASSNSTALAHLQHSRRVPKGSAGWALKKGDVFVLCLHHHVAAMACTAAGQLGSAQLSGKSGGEDIGLETLTKRLLGYHLHADGSVSPGPPTNVGGCFPTEMPSSPEIEGMQFSPACYQCQLSNSGWSKAKINGTSLTSIGGSLVPRSPPFFGIVQQFLRHWKQQLHQHLQRSLWQFGSQKRKRPQREWRQGTTNKWGDKMCARQVSLLTHSDQKVFIKVCTNLWNSQSQNARNVFSGAIAMLWYILPA